MREDPPQEIVEFRKRELKSQRHLYGAMPQTNYSAFLQDILNSVLEKSETGE